jgi:hypothetical protein
MYTQIIWVASNTGNIYTLYLNDFFENKTKIKFKTWNKVDLPSGFILNRLIMTNLYSSDRNVKKACVFIVGKNNQIFARGNNLLGALGVGKKNEKVILTWEKVLLPQ